jgi:uncharacterized phage protein (TIGR01671 family)
MRIIKFRGKNVNGGWAYGSLIKFDIGYVISMNETTKSDNSLDDKNSVVFSADEIAVVFPKTIGQFTGLLDKNGKEIYEGDIIQDGSNSVGVIMWFSTGWGIASYSHGFDGIKSYTSIDSFYSDEVKEWSVIGNAFENSALINA